MVGGGWMGNGMGRGGGGGTSRTKQTTSGNEATGIRQVWPGKGSEAGGRRGGGGSSRRGHAAAVATAAATAAAAAAAGQRRGWWQSWRRSRGWWQLQGQWRTTTAATATEQATATGDPLPKEVGASALPHEPPKAHRAVAAAVGWELRRAAVRGGCWRGEADTGEGGRGR